MSSSTPSLDGKGGTDSAAKVGKSTKRTGPSYVYYRLYTKLGAFESNHPIYNNDRFIGRIPSSFFAPPHTVASIKRSLCKLENLLEPDKALVFTPLSSPAPKEDSARLSLYVPSGPGLSEQDPIALVVESQKRTKDVTQPEKLPERSDDTDIQYVYYRVYASEGEGGGKANTSFDESDISLGRINTLFIAPPHTTGSLKACIAKVEGLVTPGHALYKDMELFEDMNSDAARSDTDVISFQSDTYPGSDECDPVALVNATSASDKPHSKFMKYARAIADIDYTDPTWVSMKRDEIFHTDGVIVTTNHRTAGRYTGYMVINYEDKKGFVREGDIDFDLVNIGDSLYFQWGGVGLGLRKG